MERATGGIFEIVCVFDFSDATEVLSTMWWRGFLSRGLSARLENAKVFSLLITSLSANEFTSLFSTACYGQAPFIANEAGIGYEGISTFSIPSFCDQLVTILAIPGANKGADTSHRAQD